MYEYKVTMGDNNDAYAKVYFDHFKNCVISSATIAGTSNETA